MIQKSPFGLWIISGPLGAGKTTLHENCLKVVKNSRPLRRVTTRKPRPSDVDGDYTYVSEARFRELEKEGLLLARFQVLTKDQPIYHAALLESIDAALSEDVVTITELAPRTIETIFDYAQSLGHGIQCVYLDLEDEDEARRRLKERGETDIEERIAFSRGYREEAVSSQVPYYFIDARQSKEEVLRQALDFFLQT